MTSDTVTGTDPSDLGNLNTLEAVKEERTQGKAALKELMKPVAGMLTTARIIAAVSACLTIVPFIAIVRIGGLFLDATNEGVALDSGAIWRWVIILAGTFALRIILTFIALGVSHAADASFNAHVRGRMADRLGEAPLSWFTATNSGKVRKALTDDLSQVHMMIAHQPVESIQAIISPLSLLIYAFIIDWRLGLLAIITIPIYLGGMIYMMSDMAEKTVEMDAHLARVSSTMVEFITGIAVVKAFGAVGKAHKRYQDAADGFSRHYINWCGPMTTMSSFCQATVSIPVLLFLNLSLGGLMVHADWVSANQLLATTLISLILPEAIQQMGGSMWAYQLAGAAALRIVRTLDIPVIPEVSGDNEEEGQKPSLSHYDVVFDHVSFSYGGTLAVDDVSLTLKEGTVTALVGPSGSGKSTVATLAARFADPDHGTVSIGGTDIRNMTTAKLYRTVAFVLQDPQLIRASIRRNIALGKQDATDEDIKRAAQAACIWDDIAALPQGLNTILGENTNLSGGQKQRIAIARALIKDAPVLILDEATAFTDPESEAEIQKALTRLVKGRTVLAIAHRPESVIGADQIIVLERGRISAAGTHDELKDHPGYARLWRAAEARGADLVTDTGIEE